MNKLTNLNILRRICSLFVFLFLAEIMSAAVPSLEFKMSYVTGDNVKGTGSAGEQVDGSGPITVTLKCEFDRDVSTTKLEGEWVQWTDKGSISSPDVVRRDTTTTLTVSNTSLTYFAFLGTMEYEDDGHILFLDINEDYWGGRYFMVKASESELTMPNAFSPNGDNINDVYKAKSSKSIVEFRAIIFNRWGQKIYEWNDVNGGRDGTHNGRDVSDGVYYCLVNAKGADGRVFTIKKDVNLLRGYTSTETTDGTSY